jgi:flagellar hook-associated protein 1
MTLFSSIGTALTGLQATMAALQTTGHNIANAATPGYSRQRAELVVARPQQFGRLQIGRGVNLAAVRRSVDASLEERLRDSASTLAGLGAESDTLRRLEDLLGALSDTDLAGQMDRLFGSLQDFSANPEDLSTRRQVLGSAETLAQSLNSLSQRVRESREQLNGDVRVAIDDINRFAAQIADLNVQIVATEKGGLGFGTANDLRDRRDLLLRELSDRVAITAVETSNGEVNVLAGSAFLVFGSERYEVSSAETAEDGVLRVTPVFASGNAELAIRGGRLRGLLDARDGVLADAGRDLDRLASSLAYEFNRVQSTGQGLERFADLTSLYSVPNLGAPLAVDSRSTATSTLDTLTDASLIGAADPTGRDLRIETGANAPDVRRIVAFDPATGTLFFDRPLRAPLAIGTRYQIRDLPFPVVNGGFQVLLTNEVTGVQESFQVDVDLDRLGADTTMSDLVAQLNALSPGLQASLTSDNRLRLRTTASELRVSFANDSSGFLAAAGLNAFFSGSRASDLALDPTLAGRPELLSGALSSSAGDNSGALAFAALRDVRAVLGEQTFEEFYQGVVGRLGVDSAEAQGRLENQALIAQQLENQRERISGVNIDEEAVNMIQYQRSFQASARFIGVIDELLDTLVNGI